MEWSQDSGPGALTALLICTCSEMDLFWTYGEGLNPVTSPGGNTAGVKGCSSLRRKPWGGEHWEGLPGRKVVSRVDPEG